MSYMALVTSRYDEVAEFYGVHLGFAIVESWNRPIARGVRFDLNGMQLEVMDNDRERQQLSLGASLDRVHIVVEVDDVDEARDLLEIETPSPVDTSWGARMFQVRDPDGVPISFLQWTDRRALQPKRIRGLLTSGIGKGKHFTRIDWASGQFVEKLNIDPFPGTVNVKLEDVWSLSAWRVLREGAGVRIANPGAAPGDCCARCYPVLIAGQIDAAIVLPEVPGYPGDQIELIATVNVREALGLDDGASIELEVKAA